MELATIKYLIGAPLNSVLAVFCVLLTTKLLSKVNIGDAYFFRRLVTVMLRLTKVNSASI